MHPSIHDHQITNARSGRLITDLAAQPEALMYRKMIVYNRATGDFTMYLDGEQVGTIATYGEAVETLNQRMYQLLIAQSKEKANGTDASAEPTES